MRAAHHNPFAPGSDHVPPVWVGREVELADFTDIVCPRRRGGIYERGRMVLGEPGIGKSVLINRIAQRAEAAGDWCVPPVRVTPGHDPVAAVLRTVASDAHQRGATTKGLGSLLKRIESVTLPVVGGGAQLRDTHAGAPLYTQLTKALIAYAGAAATQDPPRVVVVRIDEVQHLSGGSLAALLTALGDALAADRVVTDIAGGTHRRVLPLVVYLSGLPEFVQRVTEARTTFARRYRIIELEPLERPAMQQALGQFVDPGWYTEAGVDPIVMSQGAVTAIVDGSYGSPYLFQLLGEAAWNAGTGQVITEEEARRGRAAATREMRRYVELRLAGLTEQQRAYLTAAATLDPDDRSPAAVAAAMGRTSREMGSTARSLEEYHRLIRREPGHVVLASPGLEPYLRDEL